MTFLRRAPFIRSRIGGGILAAFLPNEGTLPGFNINIVADSSTTSPDPAAAVATLSLLSDGTGRYRTVDDLNGITDVTFTWKTGGGTVSDYYAFMDTVVGNALEGGSSATNTPLQLNVDRSWTSQVARAGNNPGTNSKQTQSTIRIRNSSGTDLISKTVQFDTTAIVG
jgi:hypothetical protein